MKKLLRFHYAAVFILYSVAVVLITYPLVFHLGSLITGFGDELLIAWIHNWVMHSLLTNPQDIFNANIYYPYKNSLAYSDFFLITSILGYIPFLVFNQPIVFVNFTIISSLIFLGFSVYWLAYYLTKNIQASFLSGLLVIFSPAVLDKFVHIQILAIAFVPLSILFFLHFLNTNKKRFLILTMACFAMQTVNSFMPGYFIAFSLTIITIFYGLTNKKKIKNILTWWNIFIVFMTLALIVPIAIPYFSVSHEFNYVRDIRETIHLALQPEDYFNTNHYSRLEPLLSNFQSKDKHIQSDFKPGFLGFVFTLLVVVSAIFFIKKYSKKNWQWNALCTISLFGFIMSFGPFLHLFRSTIHYPFPIPLPYAIFYYIIPGFQGIRNSSRWEMLFLIIAAVLISVVLHQLLKRSSFKKQLIVYFVLIIGVVVELNVPLKYFQIQQKENFPKVYTWLNTIPKDSVIIEMPIYTWDMQPYVFDENFREYYSTSHFRKMVNGASGFSPPPWQGMVKELLVSFPNNKSIDKLSTMDVDYIIVHKTEYDRLYLDEFNFDNKTMLKGNDIINQLNKNKSLKFVTKIQNDYIFQIVK